VKLLTFFCLLVVAAAPFPVNAAPTEPPPNPPPPAAEPKTRNKTNDNPTLPPSGVVVGSDGEAGVIEAGVGVGVGWWWG
jgi:hypothetical protein